MCHAFHLPSCKSSSCRKTCHAICVPCALVLRRNFFHHSTMPCTQRSDHNHQDLVHVHPPSPSKSLPQKLVSIFCFPQPRKTPKPLPVLDPRYTTFEALATSTYNSKRARSPRSLQTSFDIFERDNTGTYDRFPTPVFEHDDRARRPRCDIYLSEACKEQANWHPHARRVLENNGGVAMEPEKVPRKQQECAHEPSSTETEQPSKEDLRQHRSTHTSGDGNQPRRIVTDHFLEFFTRAEEHKEDVRPPAEPLPHHRARCHHRVTRNQQCHLCRIAYDGNVFRD